MPICVCKSRQKKEKYHQRHRESITSEKVELKVKLVRLENLWKDNANKTVHRGVTYISYLFYRRYLNIGSLEAI